MSTSKTSDSHMNVESPGGLLSPRQQLDSKSVLEIYGEWPPPDDETAKQKYHAAHLQHQTFDTATAQVKDFKEFGSGHLLYFFWLRYMTVVFVIMALIPGIPMVVMNLGGGFLATGSMDLEATTIGNFGLPSSNYNISSLPIVLPSTNNGADAEVALVAYLQSQAYAQPVTMSSLHFNKLNALVAATSLDLVGLIFFFMACIVFAIKTKQVAEKVDEQITSLPDYSVAVVGLPPDVTPEELQRHFEQWGEVVQVECARKCNTLLSLVLERRKVLDELDMATAVLQRSAGLVSQVDENLELEVLNAKYDLSLLTEAIKACQNARGGADVVRGYVTYKDDVGRDAALAAQPRTRLARWRQPREQRFRSQYKLMVTVAPEATDIYFENLEFTNAYRFVARSITWSLKALLVLIGFVLVSMAPSIKRNVNGGSGPSITTCDANCIWKNSLGQLYLNSTLRETYKTCHDTGTYANAVSCEGAVVCYECFCRAALGASKYEEAGFCDEYSSVLLQAAGAQALTVATIVLVNFIVKRLIKTFTESEKHRTRTREGLSMLTALFLTQFVNTAFSILIANLYMPEVQAKLSPGWQKVLFGGIYSDTSPNWYREVGKALIVSQVVGIPVRAAAIALDIVWVRWQWSRRPRALTQSQLEKLYEGHDFLLAERYGELLAVIFVGLLFAGGMPIMYWLLALAFLVHYNLERYELLRVCKWPISYSSHLGEKVARVMPWAALWHMLGAVWMVSILGTPRSSLFGDSWAFDIVDALCDALSKLWTNTTQLPPDTMAARLTNQAVGHLLWGFVVLALGMFVAYTWPLWLKLYRTASARLEASRELAEQRLHDKLIKEEKQEEDEDGEDEQEAEGKKKEVAVDESAASASPILVIAPPPSTVPNHSVPEFPLAVRSKLLVGPESYDMRKNPNYSYAFERLEDVRLGDALMERVEKNEREAKKKLPSVRAERRRQRREAARAALLAGGAMMEAEGQQPEGQFMERLRSQERAARATDRGSRARMSSSNQVAPQPWAGSGPGEVDVRSSPYQTGQLDQTMCHTNMQNSYNARQPAAIFEAEPEAGVEPNERVELQAAASVDQYATQYMNQAVHAHDRAQDLARAHGSRL